MCSFKMDGYFSWMFNFPPLNQENEIFHCMAMSAWISHEFYRSKISKTIMWLDSTKGEWIRQSKFRFRTDLPNRKNLQKVEIWTIFFTYFIIQCPLQSDISVITTIEVYSLKKLTMYSYLKISHLLCTLHLITSR